MSGFEKLKETVALVVLVMIGLAYLWPVMQTPWQFLTTTEHEILVQDRVEYVAGSVVAAAQGDSLEDLDQLLMGNRPLTPLLTDGVLTLPVYILTSEPIAQVLLLVIYGQVLLMLAIYWLVHELTDDRFVSIIASVGFCLSGVHISGLLDLHVMSLFWIPLGWLAVIKVAKLRSKWWMATWFVCFFAQLLHSLIPGLVLIGSSVVVGALFEELGSVLLKYWRLLVLAAISIVFILLTLDLVWMPIPTLFWSWLFWLGATVLGAIFLARTRRRVHYTVCLLLVVYTAKTAGDLSLLVY